MKINQQSTSSLGYQNQ
jgi:hypothetical protein